MQSSSSLKSSQKTLVALRQLALTAQAGRASLIEGSKLLQNIVPTDNTSISWLNAQCDLVDIHHAMDLPMAVTQDYLENFTHLEPDCEDGSGFMTIKQAMATRQRVQVKSQMRDHKLFIRSEYYNRIIKPAHLGYGSSTLLRQADGTPLVSLDIGRTLVAPDFSPVEIELLKQAQPWLEHLARKDGVVANDTNCISTGHSASLLIDEAGKVLSASPFALSILHQAADTPLADKPLRQTLQGDVSVLLRRLSNSVSNTLKSLFALPPSLTINNRWGRFHLHAYVLNAFETGTPLQISLHIEHQIPLSLGLFRLPRFLALTPREREVCLLYLAGLDNKGVAKKLGVKPSTVIYFIRQIYQRLDIYQQSDLLPALMKDTAFAYRQ